MSDQMLEVYRQARTSQDKYAYFLLAAAGAAIAFALNQTQGKALAYSQIPLGLAILSWGLSFNFGCQHLVRMGSSLFSNVELLKIRAGSHPEVGKHPQMIKAAAEGVRLAIEHHSKWAARYGRWQFSAFILGSVLYIAWHIWEMWARING